jgi:hypothetical protein
MLRGFSRVGGVLIGRPPANAGENHNFKILPFYDLRWSADGRSIKLWLRDLHEKDVPIGTFPASVVNRALHYAADGRLTTVTMATAAPLMELKILLHPALVDTPIGCRAITLDRFVDTYARRDPVVKMAEERVRREEALYRFAWYARQKQALEGAGQGASRLAARAAQQLSELEKAASAALQDSELFASQDRSLLRAKSEFFDPSLVSKIVMAHSRAGSLRDFQQALGEWRLSLTAARDLESMPERRWFDEPAQFEIWSGVREIPYDLSESLGFLRPPADQPLWPFEFMLQTAFTTPRFADDPNAPVVDEKPFEFTAAVKETIEKRVVENLAKEGDVIARMREFAILQRLFRTALDGHFAAQFPLEKLAALERATQPYVSKARTLRWNVRPGLLEQRFGSMLQLATVVAPDPSLRACSALLGSTPYPGTIPQPKWTEHCGFRARAEALTHVCSGNNPSACEQARMFRTLSTLSDARLLRQQLGVARDEEQSRRVSSCGLL